MGLLNRKPKIGIEEFCQQLYDSQIFHPIIAGEDIGKGILDSMFDSVAEADQSFAAIDHTLFYQEMRALRLELFGLAWGHKFKQEKFTIPQSVFTRHYLEENGKLEMWDIMGEYNQAIADSVTLKTTGERMEDWQVAKSNLARVRMFDKWTEANKGATTELDNCVARVANRIGADISRNDSILTKRLAARLPDRLGCDVNLNTEAIFRLSALVYGLYNGAKEAINSVNLQA
jgi:hypothetical protein